MKTETIPKQEPLTVPDRRRHARYRFSVPTSVRLASGAVMRGMSIEISASGMSALVGDGPMLDEKVSLEPAGLGRVPAVVRHQTGKIFGFEFLEVREGQAKRIAQICGIRPLY